MNKRISIKLKVEIRIIFSELNVTFFKKTTLLYIDIVSPVGVVRGD